MARPRGHAVEVTPGTWQLRCTTPPDESGRRGKRTKTFKTRQPRPRSGGYPRDVVVALAKFVAEADDDMLRGPSHTYSQLVDEWMTLANLEDQTRVGYEGYLRRYILPEFGRRKVTSITVQELDRFYAGMRDRFAPRTIRQTHAILRRSLGMAVKWGWLQYNPAAMTSPEIKGMEQIVVDAPTPEEVKALLAGADPTLHLFLLTSAALGTRRGETLALRWSDLDDAASTLRVERSVYRVSGGRVTVKGTKTGASATLAIPDDLCGALEQHRFLARSEALLAGLVLGFDAYIFTDDVAGLAPWEPDTVSHKVNKLRDKLGLPSRVNIKNLRHFHATQLLANGVDLGTVAGRLRHTDKSTTLKFYAKLDETADRKAADIWGGIL